MLLPFAGIPAPGFLAFRGDFILFVFLFTLARILFILTSLDSGSFLGRMGAGRQMTETLLTESVWMASMISLTVLGQSTSLSSLFSGRSETTAFWSGNGLCTLLTAASLFLLMLSESSRMPFDNPDATSELSMIRNAELLDTGGPDLAFFQYAAHLKMWLLASVAVLTAFPCGGSPLVNMILFILCVWMIG